MVIWPLRRVYILVEEGRGGPVTKPAPAFTACFLHSLDSALPQLHLPRRPCPSPSFSGTGAPGPVPSLIPS